MGSGEAFARGHGSGSADVGGGEANPRGVQNLIKGGRAASRQTKGGARVAGRACHVRQGGR